MNVMRLIFFVIIN